MPKSKLLYHPESECYIRTSDEEEYKQCLEDQCLDVTGLDEHEHKANLKIAGREEDRAGADRVHAHLGRERLGQAVPKDKLRLARSKANSLSTL